MYKMLGSQIGFHMPDQARNKEYIVNLQTLLMDRIEHSMVSYNYHASAIVAIQIMAYKVTYTDTIRSKNYAKLFNYEMQGP